MNSNYFDLLQIKKGFSIDLESLEQSYVNLQAIYHPDKAPNSSEQLRFLHISANLNIAYKTLVNDVSRAEYLLSLEGLSLDDAKLKSENSAFVKQILEDALEKNEFLQNVDDQNQLHKFLFAQQIKVQELVNEMNIAFLDKDMQKFLFYTYQMKYLDKIMATAQQKLYNKGGI